MAAKENGPVAAVLREAARLLLLKRISDRTTAHRWIEPPSVHTRSAEPSGCKDDDADNSADGIKPLWCVAVLLTGRF